MTHSDDNGLVLPPKLAPIQVVIIPIYKNQEQFDEVSKVAHEIKDSLSQTKISVKYDDRENFKPGYKFNEYELKGVPIRISIGPRDIKNNQVELARRDTLEKSLISKNDLSEYISKLLNEIQHNLFNKALSFRNENITEVDDFEEFKNIIKNKGGFISAHWDGSSETEEEIKKITQATLRCIPYETVGETGSCVFSGKPSKKRVLFAKSY